jgi:MFS transporter, Spinster family, sphingosine-1-phosphate transporter
MANDRDPHTAYKHYVLAVLTALLVLTGVERFGLGLMLEDIKAEFQLTDTQLGLLGGIAFALFYSLMGIPIARWADRGNRVTIVSLAALLLSVGVTLCSAVGNFVQLLLVRIGVAVGEAGCLPPSFSLIADYFNRAERPRAMAIYGGVGGAVASAVGYFGAGWLIELYGWRTTLLLLAVPGLVLAALARLTLRDPRVSQVKMARLEAAAVDAALAAPPSLTEVRRKLWANRSFRHLLLCLSVLVFFNFGIGQWTATYFIRSFGLTTGQIGTGFAVVYGASGLLGAYLGGELSSRYAAGNERLQLQGMALAIIVSSLLTATVYLAPTEHWAFGLSGLMMLGIAAINGPLFATIQTLVPDNMRAMAFTFAYLGANLIGMGLGPLAAGALSDALRPLAGEESVRYALLILSPGYIWAAWHAVRASRTIARDLPAAPIPSHVIGSLPEQVSR